jgi:rod shape-determining protein MreC
LEGIAFLFISHSSYFRHSATLAKVDAAKGSVKNVVDKWKDYFSLQERNRELLDFNLTLLNENIYLRNQLDYNMYNYDSSKHAVKRFRGISANVIENTLNKNDNTLILDAGRNDGISKDMGVISLNGVVGIVDRVADNFCTVTSLLNTSRNVNGKIKSTGIYGPVVWDRKDIRYVEMIDIPQHNVIHKGDTVVTSGHSLTFPEGILIGTVESYQLDKGVSYKIKIKLNNNFQGLYNVYIVFSEEKSELDSLKREINFR